MAGRLRRLLRPDERYAEIVSAFTPEEMQRLLAPDLAGLAEKVWSESPIRRAYRDIASIHYWLGDVGLCDGVHLAVLQLRFAT